jgi:uncharacterized protein (TIGR03085 family)
MVERALEVAERVRFADLLAEVGPDAPTLCEGWTATDLAAHMVVIEHPEAWAGGGSSRKFALANKLHDRVMDSERAKSWRDQVARVRGGPVHTGPFTWRSVRERMYIREYLVHHEDLRRANDLKPRTGVPELQEVGWTKATTVGTFALKHAQLPDHVGISLVRNDTDEHKVVRPGAEMVEVRGEPIELLLFAFGRRSAADVDLTGPDDVLSELAAGSWKV